MTTWTTLGRGRAVNEDYLQAVFNHWPDRHEDAVLAAVPRTLAGRGKPSRASLAGYGYSVTPDAVWKEGEPPVLVELKYALKYEPLALAEVLHHVQLHRSLGDSSVERSLHPVMVTSYNAWLRGAVQYLFDHGLRRDAVSFFEVDVFSAENGSRVLLFDAPCAAWERVDRPPIDVAGHIKPPAFWYKVRETGCLFGVYEECDARPWIMAQPYVIVAPTEGAPERFVVWSGEPPQKGTDARAGWTHEHTWLVGE